MSASLNNMTTTRTTANHLGLNHAMSLCLCNAEDAIMISVSVRSEEKDDSGSESESETQEALPPPRKSSSAKPQPSTAGDEADNSSSEVSRARRTFQFGLLGYSSVEHNMIEHFTIWNII